MPILAGALGSTAPTPFTGSISADQANTAANVSVGRDFGLTDWLTKGAVLGAGDLVDTVASSIPFVSTSLGIERGDLNAKLLHAVDAPGWSNFYSQNQAGIEAISGIGGAIAADLVARKFTKPAGMLMSALKTVPFARRIATMDEAYAASMARVRLVDTELAKRGALGAEQYVGRVTIPGELADVGRQGAYWKAKGLGFAKGARDAAATEAVMGVTLNQNGFLYDDSAAHNLMWMGLGVGVGGAIESFHSAYAMRKFVNSDQIRRTFANALDPEGTQDARLLWRGRDVKPLTKEEKQSFEYLGFLGGKDTDEVTNLMVETHALRNGQVDMVGPGAIELQSSRDQLATQSEQLAFQKIQKVTTKGISSDGGTRFSESSTEHWRHMQQILHNDPGAVNGAELIGAVNPEKGALETHLSHVRSLDDYRGRLEDALEEAVTDPKIDSAQIQQRLRRVNYEQTLTPQFYIDGEAASLSDAAVLDNWVEPDIHYSADNEVWETKPQGNKPGLGLDKTGSPLIPDNKPIEQLDHHDTLRMYRLGQRAIQTMKQDPKAILSLPKNPTWFQLDLAENLIRESNNPGKVMWPEGMTRESAQVESLAQKVDALRKEQRRGLIRQGMEKKAGRVNAFQIEDDASKLRIKFNLPRMTAYERGILGEDKSPAEILLRGLANQSSADVRKMSLQEVLGGLSDVKRIGDFAPTAPMNIDSLTGNSFRYMLDTKGQPTKPLLMYKRPFQQLQWSQDDLAERLAIRKVYVASRLAEGPQLTSDLSRSILDSPHFDQASRTHELMETQIQGSITGAKNQGVFGAFKNSLKNSDWLARDTAPLRSAAELQQQTQRITRDMFQRASAPLGEIVAQLSNVRNRASKLLVDQFIGFRPGWDIVAAKPQDLVEYTLPGDRKGYGVMLRDTAENRKRWQDAYGQEMPKGAVLSTPEGKPVVLDELGLKFMQGLNQLTDNIRANKNSLLAARGMKQIDSVEFYVPPPNLNGKFVGFTQDIEGNVVPGMTIIESTQENFAKARAEMIKRIADMGNVGYTFRTREEIARFANLWDRAQMDFVNPGTTAIQAGKRATGKLTSSQIDLQAMEGVLASVKNQYMNHGQDVLNLLMDDAIKNAKARSAISRAEPAFNANRSKDQKYNSVHDLYLENLTGTPPLQGDGSFWGGGFNWVENKGDQFLAAATPHAARAWAGAQDFLSKTRLWDKDRASKDRFSQLSRELGAFMPFEKAHQMAERVGAGSMPPTMAGAAQKVNQFTAAIILRVMETAMPIMNLAGIVNAMPAVVRHMNQLPGESAADYAMRIGQHATIFEGAGRSGESIGVVDMAKIMQKGYAKAWSKEAHPDFDFMVRRGYLTQEVAEFHKQFGAIDSKSSLMRFLTGSPYAKSVRDNPSNLMDRAATEKGLVGWLSILTDKSEDFSRSWAHMSGLEVADMLGIKGLEARNLFAHDMANKMIANYNPHNRPEIFQGALGASIGLFQSFILNYYQRMFRYIETKDARAFATQYAMQGSLFGVTTVPGFNEMSQLFFNTSGGEDDPMQGIYSKFGQSAGDLLAGGVLSSLPKLFGADAVDLYSRGDTAVRLPVNDFPNNLPGFTMGKKILQGVAEGIRMFGTSEGRKNLTAQQISEVASNMMPNRPLAGIIEQALARGLDTDGYGQLVTDTRNWMESTYRIMGLRSQRQSKEIDAYYRSKSAMELKSSQDEMLRLSTRAAMRAGDWDAVPGIFESYVNKGGDPRHFRRWLKQNYEAATDPKAARMLDSLMRNGDKAGNLSRLLDAGVGINDDEATEDYSSMMPDGVENTVDADMTLDPTDTTVQ